MSDNGVKSFTFYFDYYNLIDTMAPNDKKELAVAILDYVFKDIEPTLSGHKQAIFNTLKAQLTKSKNKSNSARKDITKQNQIEIKSKSNENQIEIKEGNKTSVLSFKFNDSLESKKDRGMGEEKKKTFTRPTVEEIRTYCEERHNGIDADSFYDFYESKGWFVGKNKMKDWKACVRTWERRKKETEPKVPDWFDKKFEEKEVEYTDEEREFLASLARGD